MGCQTAAHHVVLCGPSATFVNYTYTIKAALRRFLHARSAVQPTVTVVTLFQKRLDTHAICYPF